MPSGRSIPLSSQRRLYAPVLLRQGKGTVSSGKLYTSLLWHFLNDQHEQQLSCRVPAALHVDSEAVKTKIITAMVPEYDMILLSEPSDAESKFVEAALMLTFNMFENGMGREAGYE